MAKTYAGYAERDVNNDVNWAAVTKSISDVLTDSVKQRQEKKDAIDKESRELGLKLSNAEGSQHSGLNQFYLDGASAIQEVRRMQLDLLKNGKLGLRDYTVQKQNISDGIDELIGLVSGYDKLYQEKMKKFDELSGQDKYQMENIEGFSNFNTHAIYVNPLDGRVSLGKKVPGKDGIMTVSENPNDFMTISSLKNRLNRDILKYDWSKNIQEGVDRYGKIKKVINQGGVRTRESQRELKEYEESRDKWVDSMLQDDIQMGSMLSDWIGGYTFNQEKDSDDKTIQLIQNPNGSPTLVPVITDKMKKILKKRLIQEFEARVDMIETPMPQQTLSVRERFLRGQSESAIDNLAKLWYGTAQEIDSASKFLQGIIPNLVGIDVQEDKVILTKTDKDGSRTGKKGGRYPVEYARNDFDLFIESIAGELGGTVSASEAVRIAKSKLPKDRTGKGGIGTFLIPEAVGLPERFGNYIETYLTTTDPLSKDEEKAKSQLEGLLKPFGNFEIEEAYAGDDRVKITYPTGKTTAPLQVEVDLSDADAVRQIKNFLVNNLSFFQEGVAIQESNINEALSRVGIKKSLKGDDILKGTN